MKIPAIIRRPAGPKCTDFPNAVRWPLRNQVLLPTILLVLAVVAGTSLVHAWLALRGSWRRIGEDLDQVTATLDGTNFPLTRPVLLQMRGLSGAEFAVEETGAGLTVTTFDESRLGELNRINLTNARQGPAAARLDGSNTVRIGDQEFLHSVVPVRGFKSGQQLHIFYPLSSWRQARWDAVLPSLIAGAVAFVLASLVSFVVAQRVSLPLRKLRDQVDRVSTGDFRQLAPAARNDEVADLGRSVNQMAAQLQGYENEVRQSERLRTLDQIGAGLAHQLRNSATGCRLAVELYCQRHPEAGEEGLRIAVQQLDVIENYLHRFLALGQRPKQSEREAVEADGLVHAVTGLMSPLAAHLGVELRPELDGQGGTVTGSRFELEQMLANLVRNGIEAAAARVAKAGEAARGTAMTRIRVERQADVVELQVLDNGDGPAEPIRENLFQPFQTDKPEGSGLGLSIARLIALDHDGTLDWQRRGGETVFRVRLPRWKAAL